MTKTSPADQGAMVAKDSANPDPLRLALGGLRHWWQGKTADVDRVAVIEKIRSESHFTARYAFMICMSAGIAILGLLLSSPAVVIGAMLLSPLMSPILGAGFALAIGDILWLRQSGKALALGTLIAIAFCTLIVLMSPLQTVTSEIAARTRPNLFDLAVALFSALAGAYAMIWGREGTIVGVAIATALMPPLAVVGFGIATANSVVLTGSMLLFFTNLMTIALTATAMARLNGFGSALSPKQSLMQTVGMLAAFIVLALPLGLSLRNIARETTASRLASSAVAEQFDKRARVSQLNLDFAGDPVKVSAEVLTTRIVKGAEKRVERELERQLGVPVDVSINQLRVGSESGAADSAELAVARQREVSAAIDREVSSLIDQLALVAGVPSNEVLVDRVVRRASVRARGLPNAGLGSYYTLERRIAVAEPNWTVEIVPPALPLPAIALDDGDVSSEATGNVTLAIWAAKRVSNPVAVSGPAAAAESFAAKLRAEGVRARAVGGNGGSQLKLQWLAPDAMLQEAQDEIEG